MNRLPLHHTAIFSVFLFTAMTAVMLLTVSILHSTRLLPAPVLTLIAAAMVLAALLLSRLFFPASNIRKQSKRLIASTLSICLIAACALSSYTALLAAHSLRAMFGSMQQPITAAQSVSAAEPFAVYLGGSDTRSSAFTKSRWDVNILAVVSPTAQQVLLVNTPRDYYVPNPAGGGAKDKLTHCGLYGLDNTKQAMSLLYGIPVDYGAVINFDGFARLIDAMGGITVTSDTAFTTSVGGYSITPGENHLNGAQALALARERKHLSRGDNARGENQMQILTAMLRQCTDCGLSGKLPALLSALEGTFTTDIPLPLLSELVVSRLADIGKWELLTYSVTGTDSTARCWSMASEVYVMVPDASVETASAVMQQMLQGAVITPEMLQ